MNLVKKLSASALGYDKTHINHLLRESNGKPVFLYALTGKASKTVTGDGQHGPWTAFVGRFAAIIVAPTKGDDGYQPGEEVRSNRTFLHQPMEDMVVSALTDQTEAVEFAVETWVQVGTKGDYEYIVKPVLKVQEADEMSSLLDTIRDKSKIPALPPAKKSK